MHALTYARGRTCPPYKYTAAPTAGMPHTSTQSPKRREYTTTMHADARAHLPAVQVQELPHGSQRCAGPREDLAPACMRACACMPAAPTAYAQAACAQVRCGDRCARLRAGMRRGAGMRRRGMHRHAARAHPGEMMGEMRVHSRLSSAAQHRCGGQPGVSGRGWGGAARPGAAAGTRLPRAQRGPAGCWVQPGHGCAAAAKAVAGAGRPARAAPAAARRFGQRVAARLPPGPAPRRPTHPCPAPRGRRTTRAHGLSRQTPPACCPRRRMRARPAPWAPGPPPASAPFVQAVQPGLWACSWGAQAGCCAADGGCTAPGTLPRPSRQLLLSVRAAHRHVSA